MKKPSISLSAVVSVISQKMTMRKLPTAIFTASALSIAIISSGCSRPEPVEQNAPKYGLVTADVTNEDSVLMCCRKILLSEMSQMLMKSFMVSAY